MDISAFLHLNRAKFTPVVPFVKGADKLAVLDFTAESPDFHGDLLSDPDSFGQKVDKLISSAGARYGYGGYAEHRTVYAAAKHFDAEGEPRRLHLGIDIWGSAGTPVMAPFGGLVHSMAFNNHKGDYGATIILAHQLEDHIFYTLYGHVSLADIDGLRQGTYLVVGETFAHIGQPFENGGWPPHLHFQIIEHMGNYFGDYPGVCKYSERHAWLANSPDPALMLQML